jgi:hypothetical protein
MIQEPWSPDRKPKGHSGRETTEVCPSLGTMEQKPARKHRGTGSPPWRSESAAWHASAQ